MEKQRTKEERYLKAKKRVKDIKGFYIHLAINVFSIVIIVTVNLLFSPGFHWFWFAVFGIVISQLIHLVVVFGFPQFGLDRDWEAKKIEEIMNKNEEKSKRK